MKKINHIYIHLLVTLLIGIASSLVCFAHLNYVTVESRGTGSSAKAAVYDAITEALGQVNGMQIASQTSHAIAELSVATKDGEDYFASEAFKQQVQTATKGIIKNYHVISLGPDPDDNNLWNAHIQATIAKYKVSKQTQRLRMALVPFRINPNVSDSNKAAKFEQLFAQALVSYLTQTRKFAILDREFMKEQNLELNLIQGSNFAVEEMARLGNQLGTDYIIVGAIDDVVDKRWTQTMETTGKKFAMHQFGSQISYQIIDVATGQVLFSDMYDRSDKSRGKGPKYTALARNAADSVGQKIINAIYPIVVTSVRGKTVYLAQGGGTIKADQKMELIKYGDLIIDPYTKESLGREEIQIGMIRITKVQSKMAQAKIITSSIDLAAEFALKSFIVRPIKEKKLTMAKQPSQIKEELKKDFEEFEKDSDDDW
jgi:TolB-like protein